MSQFNKCPTKMLKCSETLDLLRIKCYLLTHRLFHNSLFILIPLDSPIYLYSNTYSMKCYVIYPLLIKNLILIGKGDGEPLYETKVEKYPTGRLNSKSVSS